ncbi:MAG: DUF177 domain-containing protein [Bacillaceae bacterium]|nr:DUF177 domain-containing protein [Bacillaceae bacterium]
MPISIKELKQQPDENLPVEETLDVGDAFKKHPDVAESSPLTFSGKAYTLAGLIMVEGQITGELTLSCSRCLKKFSHPISLPFQAAFVEEQTDIELEDESDVYEVGEEIDLLPYVVEEVLLNLDPVPLCDRDCKGLCPNCGTDLNESSCECKVETIDPRLADLAKFFEKDEDGQSS